jgi:hypothetical protein
MKLSIDSLTEAGAFVGAPVEKEITWTQGEQELSATVHIRRMSYQTTVAGFRDEKEGNCPIASRIASCVLDETGKPIFTAGDITGDSDPARGPLDSNLTMSLLAAIGEVNNLSGKPKPSAT